MCQINEKMDITYGQYRTAIEEAERRGRKAALRESSSPELLLADVLLKFDISASPSNLKAALTTRWDTISRLAHLIHGTEA